MKKLILPIFVFASAILVAQPSLKIVNPIYSVNVVPKTNPTAVEGMEIKNISSDTIYAKVVRKTIFEVSGTTNYFCWDQCFTPDIDTGGVVTLGPDSSTHNFIGDYAHEGLEGTTIVQYCFYNRDDISDSVCINISYVNGVNGIEDVSSKLNTFTLSPNPVVNSFTVNYEFQNSYNNEFVLYDLLGNVVMKRTLTNMKGIETFNTSAFNAGIYFFSVKGNNKNIKTERIVITK